MKINFGKIRSALTWLTNLLLIGRTNGWWSRKNTPNVGDGNILNLPHKPGQK